MARRRFPLPDYKTWNNNGCTYYRTRVTDADGNQVTVLGKTKEELFNKVQDIQDQFFEDTFHRECPTVKKYAEKWLRLESEHLRHTTMVDYTSKVKNYIIKPMGEMYMCDVTPNDVKEGLLPVGKKSRSVYHSIYTLYKSIFNSAVENNIISKSPCENISWKGGVEPKGKKALTDEQVKILLDSIRGLPPYLFVMIGLYAGLRREEIWHYNGIAFFWMHRHPIFQYSVPGTQSTTVLSSFQN